MTNDQRVRRGKLIREAEGYLDLAIVFDDRWPLDIDARSTLAARAIDCLDQIEDGTGKRAKINYLKGQALRIAEKYSEAIEALQESSRIDTDNIHTFLALGWCFKRMGSIELAIDALHEALNVDQESAITHYNLACYWALLDHPKSAIHHLAIAFELEDSFRELVQSESDFDLIRNNPDFLSLTSMIA
jgi:tetratricopeptide (TPR) repeat protein